MLGTPQNPIEIVHALAYWASFSDAARKFAYMNE